MLEVQSSTADGTPIVFDKMPRKRFEVSPNHASKILGCNYPIVYKWCRKFVRGEECPLTYCRVEKSGGRWGVRYYLDRRDLIRIRDSHPRPYQLHKPLDDKPDYIYFIKQDHGDRAYVKIGISRNPKERLKYLQTASPVELELMLCIEGDRDLERLIHGAFADDRAEGEWFEWSPQIDAIVAHLSQGAKFLPEQ